MSRVARFFRRKDPQAERVPLRETPWLPDRSGLAELQSEKELQAEELERVLFENEELEEHVAGTETEETALAECLARVRHEMEQHEAAEEASTRRREERVIALRRLSENKTEEVSDLRRKSVVQDVHIAELRRKLAAASASQQELQECEAGARDARGVELRAHREWVDNEAEQSELLASLETERLQCIQCEVKVKNLTDVVEEAQAEATRKENSYWEDATFLKANEDVVVGYENQIRENREACAEIEVAIEKHHALQEAALQDESTASANADDKIPPALISSFWQTEETQEASQVALRSHSRSPVRSVRTSPQCSPRMLLERTPLPAPSRSTAVQAALATLHSENDRLRQKVDDMRKAIESRPCNVQEDVHSDDRSFDAAVAGTGARVVHQMKQSLHDRINELRTLHHKKQELDRERRRERRLRADLERRLASVSASRTDAQRNSDSRRNSDVPKESTGATVFHSL